MKHSQGTQVSLPAHIHSRLVDYQMDYQLKNAALVRVPWYRASSDGVLEETSQTVWMHEGMASPHSPSRGTGVFLRK